MELDLRTLFFMTLASALLFGGTQLLVWRTHRAIPALLMWSLSNFCGAAGNLLVALRGVVPDVLSIGLGNALVLAWLLLLWAGMRRFDHQPVPLRLALLAPPALFLLFTVTPVADNLAWRTMIVAALNGLLVAMGTIDLWRAQRREPLAIRWFLIALFAITVPLCLLRVALSAGLDPSGNFMQTQGMQVVMLVHMNLFLLGWNVSGLLLVNERMQNQLSRAATTDTTTGLLNRTEFFHRAERLLERARVDDAPVALLMVGLRHLQSYNTQLGNAASDESLRQVAAALVEQVRANDLASLLGGELFAVLLIGSDADAAETLAQRLCKDIDQRRIPHPGAPSGSAFAVVGYSCGRAVDFASARSLAEAANIALLRAQQQPHERIARFIAPLVYSSQGVVG